MHRVILSEMVPQNACPHALHEVRAGQELLRPGSAVNFRIIQQLRQLPDPAVIAVQSEDEAVRLRQATNFEKLEVAGIIPGHTIASDVYAPDGKLLLSGGTQLSESFLNNLLRRNIPVLWVRKQIAPDYTALVQHIRQTVQEEQDRLGLRLSTLEQSGGMISGTEELSFDNVLKLIRLHTAQGTTSVAPDGEQALLNIIQVVDPLKPRPEARKSGYLELYRYLLAETRRLYGKLAMLQEVDHLGVAAMCNEIIEALVEDRHLLLAALFSEEAEIPDYLARHALNVAILSVNIAATHGYSHAKIMEIGHGALLVDIGMLCIPDAIRLKEGSLEPHELLEMQRHAIYGIERLRCIKQLPQTTALVAYQCHERSDGTGYPDAKKGHAIHDYAKLTAVADVFNALIERRPWRKRPALPYRAMEEVLKMAAQNRLEKKFVRALLDTISLFPVGSWVRLSTGEVAQVLAAHGNDHTRPCVSVLYDADGQPCSARRMDLRFMPDVTVTKAEKVSVAEPLAGF